MKSTLVHKSITPFKWLLRGISLIIVTVVIEKLLKNNAKETPSQEGKFAADCEKDPDKCSAYQQCLAGNRIIDSRVIDTCELMRKRFPIKTCPPTPEQIVLRQEIKQILEGTEASAPEKK
jgi:hypothetical protein